MTATPGGAASDIAVVVASYFMELVRCNVPQEVALELTAHFQTELFALRFPQQNTEDDDDD